MVLGLVVTALACSDTEELEQKVGKLEEEVAGLRKDRGFYDMKHEELLREIDDLERKLDELSRKPPPSAYPSRPARRQPDPAKTYAVPIDPADPVDGPSDALVTIVEGYEYACPYCEKVRPTLEELKKKYGRDLRVVYKQLVVHPQTATAPALAACAANKQQKFAAMDRALWEDGFKLRQFDKASCWTDPAGCALIDRFARKAGIDRRRMVADMKGACTTWLRTNEAMFRKLSTLATPTFFINGRHLSGAQPIDRFEALIDEELAKARARVQQGTPRAEYYDRAVVDEGQPELDP